MAIQSFFFAADMNAFSFFLRKEKNIKKLSIYLSLKILRPKQRSVLKAFKLSERDFVSLAELSFSSLLYAVAGVMQTKFFSTWLFLQ